MHYFMVITSMLQSQFKHNSELPNWLYIKYIKKKASILSLAQNIYIQAVLMIPVCLC